MTRVYDSSKMRREYPRDVVIAANEYYFGLNGREAKGIDGIRNVMGISSAVLSRILFMSRAQFEKYKLQGDTSGHQHN